MRYAPPGMCLNDFAVLPTAHGYDVLHLQGPWTDRFDERVMETSFGHARSRDLVTWDTLGPCFGVGQPDRFDANAVWTMHPFPAAGGTAMVYTGVRTRPWADQAIGLAYTDATDATGWARVSTDPIVRADPRWYRTGPSMAWRDPFVVADAGSWFMVMCASDATSAPDRSGCVGLAVSDDLVSWEVLPPIISPGDVDELECPVLERTERGWLLLGCHGATHQIEAWSASVLTGPWRRLGPIGPVGPYAPRLVDGPDGDRLVLHTVQRRTGLRDDGRLCRGLLAQPKKLDLGNPDRPRLAWWSGNERHLGPPTTEHTIDGLVHWTTSAIGQEEIVLRGSRQHPVLSLVFGEAGLALVHRGRTRRIAAGGHTRSGQVRILLVGEFVEIYLDDILVAAESSYYPACHPMLRHNGERIPMRPLLPPATLRDDISAVPVARSSGPAFAGTRAPQELGARCSN